jgi:predicted amidohydrolase
LLAEVVALAEEVCVLRDRLDTAQRLSDKGETASATTIDAFELDAEMTEARLRRHQEYFEGLFARVSKASGSR